MGSSDEALLAGVAAGDRDASAEFVRRFQRRAYGLARTIVDDSATAEDVAQQANRSRFAPSGSPAAPGAAPCPAISTASRRSTFSTRAGDRSSSRDSDVGNPPGRPLP